MAEYAIAGILHFAKELDRAIDDRATGTFDHRAYRPLLLEGKTMCVIGAGGIGREVGRLAAALGMRVIGTRRRPEPGTPLPAGFAVLGGTDDLDRFLGESDFVAVCCQWTPETTNLINAARLAAMKPGVVLVNVARGEIVDEAALAEALARGHLRGVVLDVYVGEFERLPPETLWRDPRVLITPHTSGSQRREPARRDRSVLREPAFVSRRCAAAQRDRLGTGLLVLAMATPQGSLGRRPMIPLRSSWYLNNSSKAALTRR